MNIAHYISDWWKEALEYKERVLKDGGTTKREDVVQQYNQMAKQNGIFDSIKFAWLGEAGGKFRTSGANQFWTKGYTLKPDRSTERRNLLTYTEEFNNSQWVNTTQTGTILISSNQLINPINGALNVYLLDRNGSTFPRVYQNVGVTTGTTYTFSVFVKKNIGDVVSLRYYISSGLTYASFNFSTKAITINSGSGSANVIELANGWFRISITETMSSNGLLGSFLIPGTYDASTTNEKVYIWGAQLEVGSSPSAYQRVIDANSWDGVLNDATQTTSTSQPYITGNIAPTERIGLKNPNGGSSYMTHPTISFAANEAWSVTTVCNSSGYSFGTTSICGEVSTATTIRLNSGSAFGLQFINSTSTAFPVYSGVFLNKSYIFSIIADGKGNIKFYINGVGVHDTPTLTNAVFNSFLYGRSQGGFGSLFAHIIRSQALTASQVAAEANFLRSLYPEIPSVNIGSQTWATSNCEMVATPQGNLIQNITANSNVEKITNAADREFSSDTGFWTKGANVTISDGVCHFVNSGITSSNGLGRLNLTTLSKFYKVVFTVKNYVSGKIRVELGATLGTEISSNGTFTSYAVAASNTSFYFVPVTSCTLDIDDVSVQEVGWSDATNLYNYIYANTSGTVEQKTYAGVKAAAMWCYYNNDASFGAVYGKLYNWYAVKLLQMDIDYYNAANPTTPWGWRVPTDTDFNTLATTLGGVSVAGGKMKKEGLVYWSSPNTGADNSSGFSAIGASARLSTGTMGTANSSISLWTSISGKCTTILRDSASSYIQSGISVINGNSLRLIKS